MRRALQWSLLVAALLFAGLALFLQFKMAEGRVLMGRFMAEALQGVEMNDTDAVAMSLSRHIFARTNRGVPPSKLGWYERWESTSFFNVTTTTSLKLGIYGVEGHSQFGPCGTMSRVLLNALWRLKIPARKLQLLGNSAQGYVNHTMVEYWSKGRWEVISPSDSSFVWRNAAGQVATLAEIQADPAIRNQIRVQRPYWPATFANARHIRWEKLPAPVRGAIRLVMGQQRYDAAETPRLYDQPRRLMFTISSSAAVLCLLLGLATRVLPGSGPRD